MLSCTSRGYHTHMIMTNDVVTEGVQWFQHIAQVVVSGRYVNGVFTIYTTLELMGVKNA